MCVCLSYSYFCNDATRAHILVRMAYSFAYLKYVEFYFYLLSLPVYKWTLCLDVGYLENICLISSPIEIFLT